MTRRAPSALAALALVAAIGPVATASASEEPPPSVASLVLVLTPHGADTPQTYAVDSARVGPGPELHPPCGRDCTDHGHPVVDIDPASHTISITVPGSEHTLTDAELVISTDHIAGFPPLGTARSRTVDTRGTEAFSGGARLTWTSHTAMAPATVVFPYVPHEQGEPAAQPSAERVAPAPQGTEGPSTTIARVPGTVPAERTDAEAGAPPVTQAPTTDAAAAAPVVAEPTFTG